MVYTDFIAAIDLGTSHLTGMIGVKNTSGMLTIVATEVENSGSCIRRGCVYNVEETASRIKRLIAKLETKLRGARIGKVYVGIGGQSLHSMDHTVYRDLGSDGVVTEEVIESLYEEARRFHPDLLDVLAAVSPVYLLDNKQEASPVGIPCSKIEARYKLIAGRPSLKRYVMNSISERAKIEVADIFVSPLSLANAVLSEDEKGLGCALIDLGAGTSKLVVYKGGKLVNLSVIPFGGNSITSDIKSLHVVDAEAERIKIEHGCAVADHDDESGISIASIDGVSGRELKLAELNNVVEARIKEILENIIARLEMTGVMNELGAGIIITGGGSELKGLSAAIKERLAMNVRYAFLRKGIVENERTVSGRSGDLTAVGLLMGGTQNCAVTVAPTNQQGLFPEEEIEVKKPQEVEKTKEKEKIKTPKVNNPSGGFMRRFKKGIEGLGSTLFDDEGDTK